MPLKMPKTVYVGRKAETSSPGTSCNITSTSLAAEAKNLKIRPNFKKTAHLALNDPIYLMDINVQII